MKEIQLTQGKAAQVDDEDFEELNQFKWHVLKGKKTYYARKNCVYLNGKQKTIRMHHSIIGKLKGLEIDHIDGNGLNNQKSNLRLVTSRQNAQNRKNQIKTSKYPGVDWNKKNNKWRARIYITNAQKHLGYFTSEIEAFEAYRKAVNAIGEKMVEQKIGVMPLDTLKEGTHGV